VLAGQAASWPTPSAQVVNDGESQESWNARQQKNLAKHTNGNGMGTPLTIAATAWPTPAARDSKGANSEEHATVTGGGRKHMDQLANFVAYSPQVPATQDGPPSLSDSPSSPQPSPKKRLNATFGEWLMGMPPGWTIPATTVCVPLEMVSWRRAQLSHLSYLLGESLPPQN